MNHIECLDDGQLEKVVGGADVVAQVRRDLGAATAATAMATMATTAADSLDGSQGSLPAAKLD